MSEFIQIGWLRVRKDDVTGYGSCFTMKGLDKQFGIEVYIDGFPESADVYFREAKERDEILLALDKLFDVKDAGNAA